MFRNDSNGTDTFVNNIPARIIFFVELISQNMKNHLVEICHFMYCAPQRVILREGHRSSALYFILDGEINVSKRKYSIVCFDLIV